MSTLPISKEALMNVREALVAAQGLLKQSAEKKAESDEKKVQELASLRAHAKVAADLLVQTGNLSKESRDNWLANVCGPNGHEYAIEAISLVTKKAEAVEARRMGHGRERQSEKRASAEDGRVQADIKYARALGFPV